MRERGAVYAMTADRGKKGEAGGGKRAAEKHWIFHLDGVSGKAGGEKKGGGKEARM